MIHKQDPSPIPVWDPSSMIPSCPMEDPSSMGLMKDPRLMGLRPYAEVWALGSILRAHLPIFAYFGVFFSTTTHATHEWGI